MEIDIEKYLSPFLHEKSYNSIIEAKRFSLDRIAKIYNMVA